MGFWTTIPPTTDGIAGDVKSFEVYAAWGSPSDLLTDQAASRGEGQEGHRQEGKAGGLLSHSWPAW